MEDKEYLEEFKENLFKKIQDLFELYLDKKPTTKMVHKDIEEETSLFLEHYVSLVEYVENAKEENFNNENLDEAKNDIIQIIMESRPNTVEKESKFTKIFKNFKKTESFVNFLTRMFNFYISENLKTEDYIEIDGRKNRKYTKAYRSAILLQEYYMKGEDLANIGLYSDDVHTTCSPEYQHRFIPDRQYLIKNLAPLLFGIDALDILK